MLHYIINNIYMRNQIMPYIASPISSCLGLDWYGLLQQRTVERSNCFVWSLNHCNHGVYSKQSLNDTSDLGIYPDFLQTS